MRTARDREKGKRKRERQAKKVKAVFAAAFALALDSIVTTAAVTATTQPHFGKVSLTFPLPCLVLQFIMNDKGIRNFNFIAFIQRNSLDFFGRISNFSHCKSLAVLFIGTRKY